MPGLSLCVAVSLHVGLGSGWNSVHPCIRYEAGPWSVGAYLNSESHVSPFLSYTIGQDRFAEIGVVGGYSMADAVPMVRFGYRTLGGTYFIAPGWAKDAGFGLVLGQEWRF